MPGCQYRQISVADRRDAGMSWRLTMYDVFVAVPGELRQRVLAVLVGGEEARVRRARAQHHRRHAADGPAGNVPHSIHRAPPASSYHRHKQQAVSTPT